MRDVAIDIDTTNTTAHTTHEYDFMEKSIRHTHNSSMHCALYKIRYVPVVMNIIISKIEPFLESMRCSQSTPYEVAGYNQPIWECAFGHMKMLVHNKRTVHRTDVFTYTRIFVSAVSYRMWHTHLSSRTNYSRPIILLMHNTNTCTQHTQRLERGHQQWFWRHAANTAVALLCILHAHFNPQKLQSIYTERNEPILFGTGARTCGVGTRNTTHTIYCIKLSLSLSLLINAEYLFCVYVCVLHTTFVYSCAVCVYGA